MPRGYFRSAGTPAPQGPRRLRRVYVAWCCLILFGTSAVMADIKLRPSIAAGAEAIATRAATDALNDAVTEDMARNAAYGRIVQVEKDRGGQLDSANFDFASVIQVQTDATARAQARLQQLGHETFRLPLLQAVGGSLLSSYGPALPVRTYLVGSAHSSIQAEAKSVGINQTVHMLYLDLTAQVHVVAPLISRPLQVHSRVLLAYVIVNGRVPNTYVAPGYGTVPFPYASGSGKNNGVGPETHP